MADLLASPSCTAEGVGQVALTYSGSATPISFIFQLIQGVDIIQETAPTSSSTTLANVANGTYEAIVLDGNDRTQIGDTTGIMVDCTPVPDPEPVPVETPGTATPPAAKYMAVGGTLSNPIEYTFAFQVNNVLGDAKVGHHVVVNIYKEDEVTPSATTRARIRNGQAKVDVSKFVRALLSIIPPAGAGIIQVDTGALVRYHIGFVEMWGTTVMDEVLVADKYAVNAALQSVVNDFTDYVIKP